MAKTAQPRKKGRRPTSQGHYIEVVGEAGERLAEEALRKALGGEVVRLKGRDDRQTDMLLQYPPLVGVPPVIHVLAQVKTSGKVRRVGDRLALHQGVSEQHLRQWQSGTVPCVVCFVDASPEARDKYTGASPVYWTVVRPHQTVKTLFFSPHCIVTPATRTDLTLELFRGTHRGDTPLKRMPLLRPPLSSGLRRAARDYYRRNLVGRKVHNPWVGEVGFTWSGWNHLIARRRALHIFQSLQILPCAAELVASPGRFCTLRRLESLVRGEWTFAQRLIVFERDDVPLDSRANASIVIVLRERLRYLTKWQTELMPSEVHRKVVFESLYERPPRVDSANERDGKAGNKQRLVPQRDW